MRFFSPRRRFAATLCLATAALLPLALIGCSGGGGTPAPSLGVGSAIPSSGTLRATDFFPLQEGNEFAVTDVRGMIDITRIIKGTFEGQQAFGAKSSDFFDGTDYEDTQFYVIEGSNVKHIGAEFRENGVYKGKFVAKSSEDFQKIFNLPVGGSSIETIDGDDYDENNIKKPSNNGPSRTRFTRLPNETVELSFGRFECLVFQTENLDAGGAVESSDKSFIAPGLFYVKSQPIGNSGFVEDILTGARVNGKVYGTLPSPTPGPTPAP